MTTAVEFITALQRWQKAGKPAAELPALEAMRAALAGKVCAKLGVADISDATAARRAWNTRRIKLS